MEFSVEFYEKRDGSQPVKEFLDSLSQRTSIKLMTYIKLLMDKGFLPFPYSRNIEGVKKLRELRVEYASNVYRIFYFMHTGRRVVLLHAFRKKTNKTPKREIMIAKDRMLDFIKGA
jgi:phage-related protein